jgi:hypothetical protein
MFMNVVVPLVIFLGILFVLIVGASISTGEDEYKAKRYLADKYDEEQRLRISANVTAHFGPS